MAGSGTEPFADVSEIRPRRFGPHVPPAVPGVNQLVSLGVCERFDSKRQNKKQPRNKHTVSHNSVADLLAWLSYKIHSWRWC